MRATLLLRLAGPLQAWGDSSRFTRRETRSEPTKSGVIGLLAAASGRRRTDEIEDLARLGFAVRVDQPGRILRDFQTARRLSDGAIMPLSQRFYLSDAVFVAGVAGDQALLEGLDECLRSPEFPVYLGRRSCPPMGRVSLGVTEMGLQQAVEAAPWEAAAWYRKKQPRTVNLRLVIDAAEAVNVSGERESVRDIPVSFNPERREYTWRDVIHTWVAVTNPDSELREDDFFAAVMSP